MQKIIPFIFFLTSLFAQYEIEGRWHLVGYEDNVMYQFEDNYRYSIYSEDGTFGSIEDGGGTPNPYTVVEDIITIDLFFGNIVNYQMNYICDGQIVEFENTLYETIHSTLFREGYNYIDNECEEYFEECFDFTGIDFGACEMVLGIGYVDGECNYVSGCGWILNGIDYSDEFFDSMDECSSACFENSFTLGDINNDSLINVQDIVLLVSFVLQIDFPTDIEFLAADYNGDGILNILDVVSIVDLILNPQTSIQINSGTSYGECWGYCVFELQLNNSNALFTASGWGWYEFPDLLLEDNLSQEMWQQIIELIDFEYSNYNFRGIDLASYVNESAIEYGTEPRY
jgi:hypothetical protein